jgi:hypothetical protein
MDKRSGFFKTLQALGGVLGPFGPLLTLPGEARRKRLGVWFQGFCIAFEDVRGLDPNDVRDSTRLTRGKQSHGNRNSEVVQ